MDHRNTRIAGALSLLGALVALAAPASAQTPVVNFGTGIEMRFENSTNYDSATPAGQTKLVVNTHIDATTSGPFVLTLEQSRRVLATGSCEGEAVTYSGDVQPGEKIVRECQTGYVPSASIRTTEPVDVVLALVDDATDARTELYRGTFPVYGFTEWLGTNDGVPQHVEQRALRLDSFYSVGFVRSYGADLTFNFVTTQNAGEQPDDTQLRCKVGTGTWTAYPISFSEGTPQVARNRVWADGSVSEAPTESIHTKFYRFNVRLPIAVRGRGVTPTAGSSMDGDWTCEVRYGGAAARVVGREFRFAVAGGYIVPHALESQVPVGTGVVMVAAGLPADNMPAILDPALVRDWVAGRRLTGATSPLVSPLPTRAVNPTFTTPRAAPTARGSRGRR